MQQLDSGLDWTMDWTLDWTLDSMYFSAYRPCHHKYSPSFASTSVLRRFCTLACIVFWLSQPAKAGLLVLSPNDDFGNYFGPRLITWSKVSYGYVDGM